MVIYTPLDSKASLPHLADVPPNLRSIGGIVVALPLVKQAWLIRLGSSESRT